MGILDIFKSEPAPAVAPATTTPVQAAPTAAPPGNIPDQATPVTQQSPTTEPNGVVPAAIPEKKDESPLAEFNTLWDTDPKKVDDKTVAVAPGLNQEAVAKAMAKTDFSAAISPEHLTAIAAGGEEAQKAFALAMNQVTQQAMTTSTMINKKLTDQAITKAVEAHMASLPGQLRSQAASDHLVTSNPLFSNPAIKPVIEATQAQLLQKFPTATAAEITKMTQDYVVAMGETFAPKPVVNDSSNTEVDWEAFMQAG